MTPDSLEVALSETPCLVCRCGWLAHPVRVHGYTPCSVWQPDPPALAAAAREWMRERMPHRSTIEDWRCLPVIPSTLEVYNIALADVAKALGLEEGP